MCIHKFENLEKFLKEQSFHFSKVQSKFYISTCWSLIPPVINTKPVRRTWRNDKKTTSCCWCWVKISNDLDFRRQIFSLSAEISQSEWMWDRKLSSQLSQKQVILIRHLCSIWESLDYFHKPHVTQRYLRSLLRFSKNPPPSPVCVLLSSPEVRLWEICFAIKCEPLTTRKCDHSECVCVWDILIQSE